MKVIYLVLYLYESAFLSQSFDLIFEFSVLMIQNCIMIFRVKKLKLSLRILQQTEPSWGGSDHKNTHFSVHFMPSLSTTNA